MKIKKLLAVFASVTMLAASFTACNKDEDSSSESQESDTEVTSAAESSAEEIKSDPEEMTIKWLSYYDINPQGGNDRSLALTLFEDKFGGKIEWIPTTNDTKYDDLSRMVLGGEEVDMFPYEPDALPKGVSELLYKPLDDYIDLDSDLWSGMKETADKLQYNGKHYVVPYSITDPICIIYSRKMMKDEKLDDPYTLYEQGKWDWDTFKSMMDTFIENGGDYGCTGWLGQALVQSTGKTFVTYDGTKFTNNINDPDIEKAELMMEEMAASGTFNDSWQTYFPDSGSTLFYAMSPDALYESNGLNPDGDIFIVPFPKMPGADKYYTSCSFGAKMLAASSRKGEAVAKYLECERMSVADEEYSEALKNLALTPVTDVNGKKIRFITEEQYNVIREISDPANVSPVFDFGFGMGPEMNAFSINYDSRGAMRNLTDGLISGFDGSPSSWEELRDSYTETIDKQISKYN